MNVNKITDTVTLSINNIIRSIGSSGRLQLLTIAGQEFLRETQSNFGQGGDRYKDKAFAPLSDRYSKVVGRKTATLDKTGELRDSIKLSVKNNVAYITTSNSYAAAIAFGYAPRNLPPRNYWPMQNVNGPNYSRLQQNADKDMFNVINKKLNQLSNGSLSIITETPQRSTIEYGNIFNSN